MSLAAALAKVGQDSGLQHVISTLLRVSVPVPQSPPVLQEWVLVGPPFLPGPDSLVLCREKKGMQSISRFVLQRPFCPQWVKLWASIPCLI